jgi:hypothetical protein
MKRESYGVGEGNEQQPVQKGGFMDRKGKFLIKQFLSVLCISWMTVVFFTSTAHAKWNFGIGTGFSLMNVDGAQGFNTTIAGPVKYDVKLDPEDFSDFTKSAFGFGGYATDGNWLVQYSYGNLELEGEASKPVGLSTVSTKINFDMTGAEMTLGYAVYKTPYLVTFLDVGVRYTKHELDGRVSATGAVTGQASRNIDNDWTDAIFGFTFNVPLAQQWIWATRLNAGFGGSEGTYFASTGVTWRFLKHWSAGLTGRYAAVEFENASEGNSDWYLYDADESALSLNILYNW